MTKNEALELSYKFLYEYDRKPGWKVEYAMMLSIMQESLLEDINGRSKVDKDINRHL